MSMVNIIPKENKDWHENLKRSTVKNFKYLEKDVINPDQKAIEAYNDLFMYLEDRGLLGKQQTRNKKASRKGKQESHENWVKGMPGRRDALDRLNTLLDDALQGRWPFYPKDPFVEQKLFNQNKDKARGKGNQNIY